MSKLLYVKYNSLRRKEYQLAIYIFQDGDNRYVEKRPITPEAAKQIETIKENYRKLGDFYKNIKLIPVTDSEKGVRYNFVKGENLMKYVDEAADNKEKLYKTVADDLAEVFNVNDSDVQPFRMTEKFEKVFKDCVPEDGTEAFRICNADPILNNFLRTEQGLMCIDYEWVLDFPVPVEFIKFRTLLYLYNHLALHYGEPDEFEVYLEKFGISGDKTELYNKMEYRFQEYVFGENIEGRYTNNYLKANKRLDTVMEENEKNEIHINNLSADIDILNQNIDNYRNDVAFLNENIENYRRDVEKLNQMYASEHGKAEQLNNELMFAQKVINKKDLQIEELSRSVTAVVKKQKVKVDATADRVENAIKNRLRPIVNKRKG